MAAPKNDRVIVHKVQIVGEANSLPGHRNLGGEQHLRCGLLKVNQQKAEERVGHHKLFRVEAANAQRAATI